MGWSQKAASPGPGWMQGCAHTHARTRVHPACAASQAQFVSHKLIKANRFVLAFTETLWVFCLCLSHSAHFKERAAGVPKGPASPTQLWSPCGRWWPSLRPQAPTQGLSRPRPHGQRSSLSRSTPAPPPFPSPSEQTYVTPPCLVLLPSKASRKEKLILSKPREGR